MAKTLIGVVSSTKGDKTIVLTVVTRKTHPLYKKQYSSTNKFMAHDEKNACEVGDKVLVSEVRPLSARKRFTLVKILEKAAIRAEDTVAAVTAEPVVETPKVEAVKTEKPKKAVAKKEVKE